MGGTWSEECQQTLQRTRMQEDQKSLPCFAHSGQISSGMPQCRPWRGTPGYCESNPTFCTFVGQTTLLDLVVDSNAGTRPRRTVSFFFFPLWLVQDCTRKRQTKNIKGLERGPSQYFGAGDPLRSLCSTTASKNVKSSCTLNAGTNAIHFPMLSAPRTIHLPGQTFLVSLLHSFSFALRRSVRSGARVCGAAGAVVHRPGGSPADPLRQPPLVPLPQPSPASVQGVVQALSPPPLSLPTVVHGRGEASA